MYNLDTVADASELFIQMICDNSSLVRSHIALHLDGLFTDISVPEHNSIFEITCSALDRLINLVRNISIYHFISKKYIFICVIYMWLSRNNYPVVS